MYGRKEQLAKQHSQPKEESKAPPAPLKHLESKQDMSDTFYNRNAKFFLINFEKMLVVSD